MTDPTSTVLSAALRAATHRVVWKLGLSGAIAILAAVFGGAAFTGWKARRAKKLARQRKIDADEKRLVWRRRWYPRRAVTAGALFIHISALPD